VATLLRFRPIMTWHRTDLAADDIGAGTLRAAVVAGTRVVVVARDGLWYAVEDRCSHAGCAFSEDGEIDGFHLICNCHGSEFDIRDGQPLQPPADEPIATFPVRVATGMIEVES